MVRYPCAWYGAEVELAEDREWHIAERHPELLPDLRRVIAETLASPDLVRRSRRHPGACMVTRWFDWLLGGKHAVVVVMSQDHPPRRHWVVTAYATRRLAKGEPEWRRS